MTPFVRHQPIETAYTSTRPSPATNAGDREQRPGEPAQIVATQHERAPEEVRADRDDVVAEAECDGAVPGLAAERRLRDERVDDDERGEREREHVDDAERNGSRRVTPCIGADPEQRDREQDLLPRGDRRERAAAHAGLVERRHDGVVQREADDEEEERDRGAPPDEHCGAGEEQCVEAELHCGHAARVQRAEAGAPARREAGGLVRAPGLATEHE